MGVLRKTIAEKKAELDRLRPRVGDRLRNFDHAQDLELTFTSNAIEGNTLTAAETTLVVEQGIAVGGKRLRDHLEAIDHFAAIGYVRILARRTTTLAEMDVRNLHRLVMLRSDPEIAGRYADQGRYVLTDAGRHAFPSPGEIPALMGDFAGWLAAAEPAAQSAFDAHRRLVDIHPFDDGNGRTGRVLMNLILLRTGFPPVSVRPVDRPAYLAALLHAQSTGEAAPFDRMLSERLDATLDDYLVAIRQAAGEV